MLVYVKLLLVLHSSFFCESTELLVVAAGMSFALSVTKMTIFFYTLLCVEHSTYREKYRDFALWDTGFAFETSQPVFQLCGKYIPTYYRNCVGNIFPHTTIELLVLVYIEARSLTLYTLQASILLVRTA